MAEYLVPVYNKFPWQDTVIDKDLTAPPGGESKGDRYIVGSGASGDWSGEDGNIAYYNGVDWTFIDKKAGMIVYVVDEEAYYAYTDEWEIIGTPTNLASAVSLKHTQNTDTQLDSGVVEVDGSDNVVILQNSVNPFQSVASSAVVNTLVLKEGKVGIGTDSPGTQLEIAIFAKSGGQWLTDYSDATGDQAVLLIQKSHNDVLGTLTETINGEYLGKIGIRGVDNTDALDYGVEIYAKQDGASGVKVPTNLIFETYSSTAINNNQFVLHNDGNVGIGTDAPDAKLHIQVPASGNKQAFLIEQLDTTNNPVCAEINNDGTGYGLYIHQDGVLASSKNALRVYSDAIQVIRPLVAVVQDNASSTKGCLELSNDGTGSGFYITQAGTGVAQTIVNAGTKHGLYINQTDVLDASNYSLYVYSNAVQVNADLVKIVQDNASSAGGALTIQYDGIGFAIDCGVNSVLNSGKAGLRISSNAVQVNSPLALFTQDNASSTANVVEIDNDGTGHGLYIHQDGVLASSKYGLYVYSNAVQVGQLFFIYSENSSSTATTAFIRNDGTGHGLVVSANGVLASSKYGLYVYSSAIQINNPLILFAQENGASTSTLIEIKNEGTGHGLYLHQEQNLASAKYLLYLKDIGTPVDGNGRCIRLDGCTIASTKDPTTDAPDGFIAINIDGTQKAVPYYALS